MSLINKKIKKVIAFEEPSVLLLLVPDQYSDLVPGLLTSMLLLLLVGGF